MPFIIAEIAQAHEGSLGLAHSYIDALANCGVDAIKFQTHIADAESSIHEPFRVHFSKQDKTRYDYWKRMEFTFSQWVEIKAHCEEKGVEFMSTPFSLAAVTLLENVGVKRYKIGSGDTNNLLLLSKIAETEKPVILSSGMSSWDELSSSIHYLQEKKIDVSLLQCTTSYPTPPDKWGLDYISLMKKRFQIPIGFSDHSGTPAACIAATALGAEILEFHAVFDKRMFGPDATSSLNLEDISWLVASAKQIQEGLKNSGLKENDSTFSQLKTMFGRSIAVNQNIASGTILTLDHLESKKPADQGIAVTDFEKIIGKKLKIDKQQWDFLQWRDLI